MITTAHALLSEEPDCDAARVREVLSGNLCRCTGYISIVEAVLDAHLAGTRFGIGVDAEVDGRGAVALGPGDQLGVDLLHRGAVEDGRRDRMRLGGIDRRARIDADGERARALPRVRAG